MRRCRVAPRFFAPRAAVAVVLFAALRPVALLPVALLPVALLPVALLPAALLPACGSGTVYSFHDASAADARADANPGTDASAGLDAAASLDANPGADAALQPDANPGLDAAPQPDADPTGVVPPLGGSSGGAGGAALPNGQWQTASGVSYLLIVPSGYQPSVPNRAMIVYSGTEGAQTMANNLLGAGPSLGLGDVIFAVLDGVTYNGDGQAGATALDDLRARYNIDNDRTYLLSESAGTTAGLQLGLDLRQSYFAAYWANDVNAQATPTQTAAQLGFAPWGNAGPGGDFPDANAIVSGMQSAGYRLPADAPYSGPGASTHGDPQQFMAALQFFSGKSRQ